MGVRAAIASLAFALCKREARLVFVDRWRSVMAVLANITKPASTTLEVNASVLAPQHPHEVALRSVCEHEGVVDRPEGLSVVVVVRLSRQRRWSRSSENGVEWRPDVVQRRKRGVRQDECVCW